MPGFLLAISSPKQQDAHSAIPRFGNLLRHRVSQNADMVMATLMSIYHHTRKVAAAGPLKMQLRKSDARRAERVAEYLSMLRADRFRVNDDQCGGNFSGHGGFGGGSVDAILKGVQHVDVDLMQVELMNKDLALRRLEHRVAVAGAVGVLAASGRGSDDGVQIHAAATLDVTQPPRLVACTGGSGDRRSGSGGGGGHDAGQYNGDDEGDIGVGGGGGNEVRNLDNDDDRSDYTSSQDDESDLAAEVQDMLNSDVARLQVGGHPFFCRFCTCLTAALVVIVVA
jgi:hypothetical protein